MRTSILIIIISLLCYTITQAQIINTYTLENVHFEPTPNSEFLTVILKGKGKYERMDYPRIRIFVNNALVADSDLMYGVIMDNKYQLTTNLKEAPKNFECLVVITNIHQQNSDLFAFKNTPPVSETKEEKE